MNLSQNDLDGKRLNSYVVSASVTNATGRIKNLKEYVSVTLYHLTTRKVSSVFLSNVQKKNRIISKLSLPLTERPGCPVCLLGFQYEWQVTWTT